MQKKYLDQDPGPFVSHTGNPENGDWEEYAMYVATVENLSLAVAKEAYQKVCEGLKQETVLLLEKGPLVVGTDSPRVAHAKILFKRIAILESGIVYGRDGSVSYRV